MLKALSDRYLEEELKLTISHSRREISFRFANEEEKQLMDLADYEMVVVVTSVTYLSNGQAFQYGTISYRPDKVSFVLNGKTVKGTSILAPFFVQLFKTSQYFLKKECLFFETFFLFINII